MLWVSATTSTPPSPHCGISASKGSPPLVTNLPSSQVAAHLSTIPALHELDIAAMSANDLALPGLEKFACGAPVGAEHRPASFIRWLRAPALQKLNIGPSVRPKRYPLDLQQPAASSTHALLTKVPYFSASTPPCFTRDGLIIRQALRRWAHTRRLFSLCTRCALAVRAGEVGVARAARPSRTG
ncbi:hypothetical protein PsYK624_128860 [Phanerochaete sordida]|uniref:Uncharacterized protein n=1 Tax=Phanerochaete sordida TaxID=48140 RepID=A0A9P3GKP3_9APHY|nr:hypothetical protein PsYK624_128860 [Phanerochaete sordida]